MFREAEAAYLEPKAALPQRHHREGEELPQKGRQELQKKLQDLACE